MGVNKQLRFGLVGCGSFGAELSAYIQEVADLVAVCDSDPSRAAALATSLGSSVRAFDDWQTMYRTADLDAVAVVGPNYMHSDATIDAAAAGLHVFCEKPMALTTADCWRMVNACEKANVRLMVGHKRRLRPAWARFIQLTGKSFVGQPLSIQMNAYCDYRGTPLPNSWWSRSALSGGLLFMNAPHAIDLMHALAGRARNVSALYGPKHDAGFEYPDTMHVRVLHVSGAISEIAVATLYPLTRFRQSQGVRMICRNGGAELIPDQESAKLIWQRLDDAMPNTEHFGNPGFDHAYRLEIGDFVRWIVTGEQPCLTWREGLHCVQIMEAAQQSAAGAGQEILIADEKLQVLAQKR